MEEDYWKGKDKEGGEGEKGTEGVGKGEEEAGERGEKWRGRWGNKIKKASAGRDPQRGMLDHHVIRPQISSMIRVGGLKRMLGGAEVVVGMSNGSIFTVHVIFLDVTVPIEGKGNQLATNVIRLLRSLA